MSEKFKTADLSEMEIPTSQALRWATVRAHLGIEAFGVNAWTADEAGKEVISEHDEASGDDSTGHQELYVLLKGRATFTVDGEQFEAAPGTFVFVRDPTAKRKVVADEPETTVLAGALQEYPDDPGLLYNLACAESMLGRTDDALGHLEQAIATKRFREAAKTDPDFEPIRDDPRFKQLVS